MLVNTVVIAFVVKMHVSHNTEFLTKTMFVFNLHYESVIDRISSG